MTQSHFQHKLAMELNFEGKRALVTGAGAGLGRGIAKALWTAGAVTYAISRTQSTLDSLQEECPGLKTICLDLAADWHKTAAAVESVGDVDLLVNNAGVFRVKDIASITEEDYNYVFDINVKSVINVSKVVARNMVNRGKGGAIVNMSSISSYIGEAGALLYGASKGALDQITRGMAVELGPHQIRVNSIHPNLVPETNMGQLLLQEFLPENVENQRLRTPQKRFCKTEEIVNATLYLLSDKSDMINGAFLPVDGGFLST